MRKPISNRTKIISRRLRGWAYLHLGGMDPLHKRLACTARCFQQQVHLGALTPDVAAAVQEVVGMDAWRFICGETNTLVDAAPLAQEAA